MKRLPITPLDEDAERRISERLAAARSAHPRLSIPESEICEWYDLGWHYVGCDVNRDGRCIIEWRSSRPAAQPLRDYEADRLITAVASLEKTA